MPSFNTVGIGQRVEIHRLFLSRGPKRLLANLRLGRSNGHRCKKQKKSQSSRQFRSDRFSLFTRVLLKNLRDSYPIEPVPRTPLGWRDQRIPAVFCKDGRQEFSQHLRHWQRKSIPNYSYLCDTLSLERYNSHKRRPHATLPRSTHHPHNGGNPCSSRPGSEAQEQFLNPQGVPKPTGLHSSRERRRRPNDLHLRPGRSCS